MKKALLLKFVQNWKSGLTVGLVSVPIAISLAVASHASPVAGIISAVWAGFFASLFGGSHYNITGPTAALSGLLTAYSVAFGAECLPMLAILSGIFIYIAYRCRLERYLIFVPGSALHGFILGIAVMIICSQIPPAFGFLNAPTHHNVVIQSYKAIMLIPSATYLPALVMFMLFFIGLVLTSLLTPWLPGTILLTPIGIGLGYLSRTDQLPWVFQTLGSKYGSIDATILAIPSFHFRFAYLIPALSIAVVSIIETLISARIADHATKTKHHKSKEVLGLSLANIATGLMGGFPSTASLARTALNIRSGSTNRISGILATIFIAGISLALLPYFIFLPLPVIAAILVFVSFRMIEMEHFWRLFKLDKKNLALSLIVAFVTMYEDPVVGILLGTVAAMLLFMERLSQGFHETIVHDTAAALHEEKQAQKNMAAFIYKIKGPLAYINAQAHSSHLEDIPSSHPLVLIDIHDVHFIDADGSEALLDGIEQLRQRDTKVFLCGAGPLVEHFLRDNSVYRELKKHGLVCASIRDALAHIRTNL